MLAVLARADSIPSLVMRLVFLCLAWRPLGACGAEIPFSLDSMVPLRERVDAFFAQRWGSHDWPRSDDGEFVRRIHLDLLGRIPSVTETRAFLADASPDKREKLIDRLLIDPQHARRMAVWFDIAVMERRAATHVPQDEWLRFLIESFSADKSLEQLLREMLVADGSPGQNRAAAKFLLEREVDPHLLTRDVGRIVFGMDLQCAQCHDHPNVESYHQADYYGLFAALQRSTSFKDAEGKLLVAEKAEGEFEFVSVFTGDKGQARVRLPDGWPLIEPPVASDALYLIAPAEGVRPVPRASRRNMIASSLISTPDRSFARNWSNRLWALLFGRGLVHPLDLHHDDNPATHPELLEVLAEAFLREQGSTRNLLRELACSKAYQRTFDVDRAMAADIHSASMTQADLDQARLDFEAAEEAEFLARSARDTNRRDWIVAAETRRNADSARLALEHGIVTSTTAISESQGQIQQVRTRIVHLQTAVEQIQRASEWLELSSGRGAIEVLRERLVAAETELQQAENQLQTHRETLAKAEAELPLAIATAADSEAKYLVANGLWQAAWDQWSRARWDRVVSEDLIRRMEGLAERHQARSSYLESLQRVASLAERLKVLETLQATGIDGLELLRPHYSQLKEFMHAVAWHEAFMKLSHVAGVADQELVGMVRSRQQQAYEQAITAAQELLVAEISLWEKKADEARDQWASLAERQGLIAGLTGLTPEQLAWSLMQATGVLDQQIAACESELTSSAADQKTDPSTRHSAARLLAIERLSGSVGTFVSLFGHGAGQSQDAFYATADQSLFLGNAGVLQGWIASGGDSLRQRVLSAASPELAIDEISLTLFSRSATAKERRLWDEAMSSEQIDRQSFVEEWIWAGLTSIEFRFNR